MRERERERDPVLMDPPRVRKGLSCELTVSCCHPFGDLDEDPGVADDHHDQRQQEEAGEGEHVVSCFLPVGEEAAPSGALSEVCRIRDGHVMENEHLWN